MARGRSQDIRRLRARANDRAPWEHHRTLVVPAGPLEVGLRGLFRELYSALAPAGESLSEQVTDGARTYNWGTDVAWVTSKGNGVLLAEHCIGPLPGDGVDEVFHAVAENRVRVMLDWATDYTQDDVRFKVSANSEPALAQALQTLREVLARHGVREVREEAYRPWRRETS
jgi:hypothetical protein